MKNLTAILAAQNNTDAEKRARVFDLQLFGEGDAGDKGTGGDQSQGQDQGQNQEQNQTGDNQQNQQNQGDSGQNNAGAQNNQQQTGAPEKYKNFTLPEGLTYDHAMHEQFTTVAKKFNLSQEAAQEFVTMYAGIRQQETQALIKEHEQRVQGWINQAKADPVIAKNFDQNLAAAKESFKLFGGDDMLQLLESTGFGSHPLFIKMGMQLKARISEDNFPDGKGGGVKSVAELLYPSMIKK